MRVGGESHHLIRGGGRLGGDEKKLPGKELFQKDETISNKEMIGYSSYLAAIFLKTSRRAK